MSPGNAIMSACQLPPDAFAELLNGWGLEGCRRRKAYIAQRLATGYGVLNSKAIVEKVLEGEAEPKGIGLGDVVAAIAEPIAKVLGIKQCGGCEERKRKLNRIRLS